jgi:hypothetical protein
MTPLSSNCWVVTIDYSEDGYVKDDDASKINYDDLLKQMQAGVAENNKTRKEKGYPTVTCSAGRRTAALRFAPRINFIGPRNSSSKARPVTR